MLTSNKNLIASLSKTKTQTKYHGDKVINLCDKKTWTLKLDPNHACLAVISLDSALKRDKNYYAQVFLKKCKYIEAKSN